jgi:DNA-binding HxlR family transcriptional regulator
MALSHPRIRAAAEPSTPIARCVEHLERGEVFSEDSASREVLMHMTSRWGGLVLVALSTGTYRFGELRRKICGVSEKMLSQTLHVLESDGLVSRHALEVVPPHVEYSLTPLGAEAAVHMAAVAAWIEDSLPRILKARAANGTTADSV